MAATPSHRSRANHIQPNEITPKITDQTYWDQYEWPKSGQDKKLVCNIDNCSSGGRRLLYKNFNTHLCKHGRQKPQAVNPPKPKTLECRHEGCQEHYAYPQTRWEHERRYCKYRPKDFTGWRRAQPLDGGDKSEDESGSQGNDSSTIATEKEESEEAGSTTLRAHSEGIDETAELAEVTDADVQVGHGSNSNDESAYIAVVAKRLKALRPSACQSGGEIMVEDAEVQEGRRITRDRRMQRAEREGALFKSTPTIPRDNGADQSSLAKQTVMRQLQGRTLSSVNSSQTFDNESIGALNISEHVTINPPELLHDYEAQVASGAVLGSDPVFLVVSSEQAAILFPEGNPKVTVIVPSSVSVIACNPCALPLARPEEIFANLFALDTRSVRRRMVDNLRLELANTQPARGAAIKRPLEEDETAQNRRTKTCMPALGADSDANGNAEPDGLAQSHGADAVEGLTGQMDQHQIQLDTDDNTIMGEAPEPTTDVMQQCEHASAASGSLLQSPNANTSRDVDDHALQQIAFWRDCINDSYWTEHCIE